MSIFNSVKVNDTKYNSFDLSHTSLFSMDGGVVVPFNCFEVLPGDKVKLTPNLFFRLAPLASPLMQEINAYVRVMYVSNRLSWKNWTDFIGTKQRESDPDPVMPLIDLEEIYENYPMLLKNGSLLDYLGYPTEHDGGYKGLKYISALPFIAYQMIINEYFLNECTQEPYVDLDNVTDGVLSLDFAVELLTLRNANWRKDYFTSAMDTTQRGDDVLLPVSGDVVFGFNKNKPEASLLYGSDGALLGTDPLMTSQGTIHTQKYLRTEGNNAVALDNSNSLTGHFRNAVSTINDLRVALSTQKLLELSQRVGKRYKEQIFGFFGVDVKDSRVDRPEYLGGFKVPVMVNDVIQTSQTTEDSALGDLAGRGVGFGSSTINYTFLEHGFCMSLIYIVPRASYSQGLHKMFTRFDKLDFYFPQFAHLGEQEIKNYELYLADDGHNDDTFGYTPRYAEYKWLSNDFHGAFRANGSLANWHLGRIFGARPRLNSQFNQVLPEMVNRIFAYQGDSDRDENDHNFWVQVHNNIKILRKMPYYGTPSL